MVTMGNSMYLPTYATAASQGSIQQSSYSTQSYSSATQQSSNANAALSQMALMANNMALTGNLFMQFAAILQMLLQALTGGGQQISQSGNGYGNSQQSGSGNTQQSGYGYPQQSGYGNVPQSGYTYPQQSTYTPPQQQTPPAYNGGNNGRYWGDPHLVGFDGEQYDVMGKGGNVYNMLSDKNVQYNTKFMDWGKPGADGVQPTVIGEAGIQVGKNLVYFDRGGSAPTVNGSPLSKYQQVDLGNGQFAQWDGEKLVVKTDEYTINLVIKEKEKNGGYLDSTVTINEGINPLADGVAAHGLLGQTADGVKGARVGGDGNKNIEKQGGSVIDGVVDDYLVDNLWDSAFKYNRFDPASGEQDGLKQLLSVLNGLAGSLSA